METLRLRYLDLVNRWQALNLARKVGVAGVGVLGCALAGIFWWTSLPDYRVLYAGLSAEEAGSITAKLQAKAIPFKLSSGGTTILVPADQAMQVHLDLTTEGVPGSSKIGKGFDLFDQPNFASTPFNQHVNYLRAQQTELARTIMQIEPIVFARVHIVRPEPSPFIRDHKPTTASVMLKLRPGASLSRNIVAGIAALVGGSVEGLTKDNVRIVDSTGRLLSDERDPDTGMVGSLFDKNKDLELHLAREAERILAHVLGPGKAIVRVTAELNTKLIKERRETPSNEGRVPKSEKSTTKKSTTGATAAKGGAPGALGKAGSGATSGAVGGGTTAEDFQQTDYDFPRTIVEMQNKQGSIERLTVAAFVDMSALASEKGFELKDVQEIIKKAVGFKTDRDEIQVTQVKMPVVNSASFDEDMASHLQMQTILTIVRNVSIAMVALCTCPIVWVVVRRLTKTVPMPKPQEPKLARLSEELDRNPEALAKILSIWIDRSEPSDRKAA